jgi:hypothetical protein
MVGGAGARRWRAFEKRGAPLVPKAVTVESGLAWECNLWFHCDAFAEKMWIVFPSLH